MKRVTAIMILLALGISCQETDTSKEAGNDSIARDRLRKTQSLEVCQALLNEAGKVDTTDVGAALASYDKVLAALNKHKSHIDPTRWLTMKSKAELARAKLMKTQASKETPATGGEPERKAKVKALLKQLADESLENRQAALAELRDTLRRRDAPELWEELDRNDDPELELLDLVILVEGRWRLPDKGWTTDTSEFFRRWEKEFQDLGCQATVSMGQDYKVRLYVSIRPEKWTGVINLIRILEPECLFLTVRGSLTNITFLGTLANLEYLDLEHTGVTDLTPLKGLPNLRSLGLHNTGVTDLTPLKGIQNLKSLDLKNTKVTDLTPLKGVRKLRWLELQNTKVTDLTPLKGLRYLRYLRLHNPGVTDLTPLKGMPDLEISEKIGPHTWQGKNP
ncbi:MAG: leucine-rich repeat domain-containing protein [Phycisphaerae bacterium]|jgi:hypothetical protein|nr:leucine-rich repeat domain-containing protein [Phycisphaerae bacterium]